MNMTMNFCGLQMHQLMEKVFNFSHDSFKWNQEEFSNELNKIDSQKMSISFIASLELIFIDKKNQYINNEILKTNIVLTKVM
jgi:hypothetical protein